jgi:hypothetical protein
MICLKRRNPDLLKGTALSSLEDPNRDLLKVGAVYKFLSSLFTRYYSTYYMFVLFKTS